MSLKHIFFLLFALSGFKTFPLFASTTTPAKEKHTDTTTQEVHFKDNTTAASHNAGFFATLKHKLSSFLFRKQDDGEKKGSASAILGVVSLVFIALGLLLFFTTSQVAGGIALGVGTITGIISMVSKKRTDAQRKKLLLLIGIIGLSGLVAFAVGIAIALANYHGH